MASAFGSLIEIAPYVQPYQTDQLMQIAAFKQNQHDQNLALVDSYVNQIVNLDLMKQTDRDYLNQRLNRVIDNVNNSGVDISSSAIARNINQHLVSAVDDNVMAAINSTARVRKDMAAIEAAKQANDGTYSLQNEAFTMENVNAWLTADTVTTQNTQYNSRPYIPYRDVQAKMDKNLKEWLTLRGEQTTDIDAGGGYIIQKKVKNLNPDELRSFVYNNLSLDDRRQLQVDAWYKYGNTGQQGVQQAFGTFVSGKVNAIDSQIGIFRNRLNALTGQERTNMEGQIQLLNSERTRIMNELGGIQDAGAQALFLETEGLVEGLTYKYSRNPESLTSRPNEVFFKTAQLAQSAEQHRERMELERLRLETRAGRAGTGTGTGGVAAGALESGYIPNAVPTENEVTTLDKKRVIIDTIGRYDTASRNEASNIIKGLTVDVGIMNYKTDDGKTFKDIFDATVETAKTQARANGMPVGDTEAQLLALDELLTPGGELYSRASDTLKDRINNYNSNREIYLSQSEQYQQGFERIYADSTTDLARVSDLMTNGWFNNEASNNVYLPTLNTTLHDFINRNNLRNDREFAEYMRNNPETAKEMMTVFYTDGLLYSLYDADQNQYIRPEQRNRGTALMLRDGVGEAEVLSFLAPVAAKLSSVSGTKVRATDLIEFENTSTGRQVVFKQTGNRVIDETLQRRSLANPETGVPTFTQGYYTNFISAASPAQGFIPASTERQRSGFNDNYRNALKDLVAGQDVQALEEIFVDSLYGNLRQNLSFTVTKESNKEAHNGLYALMVGSGESHADANKPISIIQSTTSPDAVELVQGEYRRNAKGELTGDANRIEVNKRFVQPFIQGVDLSRVAEGDVFNNVPVALKPANKFIDPSTDYSLIAHMQSNGVSQQSIDMATTGGALNYLKTVDPQQWLSLTPEQLQRNNIVQSDINTITSLQQGISKIISNPSIFDVGTKRDNYDRGRVILSRGGKEVVAIDTSQFGRRAQTLEHDIRFSRNIGVVSTIGALLLRAQAGDLGSLAKLKELVQIAQEAEQQ